MSKSTEGSCNDNNNNRERNKIIAVVAEVTKPTKIKLAQITQFRTKRLETMGDAFPASQFSPQTQTTQTKVKTYTCLYPEEALFLFDQSALLLKRYQPPTICHDDDNNNESNNMKVDNEDDVYPTSSYLSCKAVYSLFVSDSAFRYYFLESYLCYCYLKRLGYTVRRRYSSSLRITAIPTPTSSTNNDAIIPGSSNDDNCKYNNGGGGGDNDNGDITRMSSCNDVSSLTTEVNSSKIQYSPLQFGRYELPQRFKDGSGGSDDNNNSEDNCISITQRMMHHFKIYKPSLKFTKKNDELKPSYQLSCYSLSDFAPLPSLHILSSLLSSSTTNSGSDHHGDVTSSSSSKGEKKMHVLCAADTHHKKSIFYSITDLMITDPPLRKSSSSKKRPRDTSTPLLPPNKYHDIRGSDDGDDDDDG